MARLPKLQFGDLYLVRGKGFLDRFIRFWTRSKFNHGGIVSCPSTFTGIAADFNGVDYEDLSQYENITILRPIKPLELSESLQLSCFLHNSLNTPYDFSAILGFLFYKQWADRKKYYCFELQYDAYNAMGRQLCRLDNEYVDGRIIYSSKDLQVINAAGNSK